MRKLRCLVVVALLVSLLVVVPVPTVQAQAPTVNGLFYGDGDWQRYSLYGYSPPLGGSTRYRSVLYKAQDTSLGIVYFALVVDRSTNDNVFGIPTKGTPDRAYLDSADWGAGNNKHTFDALLGSDNMVFQLSCGNVSWNWNQDYLYGSSGNWLSDPEGIDGGGEYPASLVSASSLQWNMNNSLWDITLGGARTSGANYKSPASGSSPVYPGDPGYPNYTAYGADTNVTDEIGYPPSSTQPADNITYDTKWHWEWPMVYEFSINYLEECGPEPIKPIDMMIIGAHNSPVKDGGDEDVPLSAKLASFAATSAKYSVVLNWETSSEIDSLGFNIWRAASAEGVKTKVNALPIRSKTPGGAGAEYTYTDTKLPRQLSYVYWVEALLMDGTSAWSEPRVITMTR